VRERSGRGARGHAKPSQRDPKGAGNVAETGGGNTAPVAATTTGEPGWRGPLAGYRVGVVAHRGRQAQADALAGFGAEVVLAPTVDAVPVAGTEALEAMTERIVSTEASVVVLTSAAGVQEWLATAEELGRDQPLRDTLASSRVLVHGGATGAATAELGVAVDKLLPDDVDEARQVLVGLAGDVAGRPVAVQVDGGTPSSFVVEALREAGAAVSQVVVAVAGLPADREPALRLVRDLVEGRVEALTLTAPAEVRNLAALADGAGLLEELVAVLNDEVTVACLSRVCQHAAASVGVVQSLRPQRSRVGAMVDALVAGLETKSSRLHLAGAEVALHGCLAVIDGQEVWLADRERALLATLARRPGTVVAKAELLRRVWRSDGTDGADGHAVEVAVGRLRRRLGRAGAALQTVPRRGYRLVTG
jgi:uroporphyrinogen-III synthase